MIIFIHIHNAKMVIFIHMQLRIHLKYFITVKIMLVLVLVQHAMSPISFYFQSFLNVDSLIKILKYRSYVPKEKYKKLSAPAS